MQTSMCHRRWDNGLGIQLLQEMPSSSDSASGATSSKPHR